MADFLTALRITRDERQLTHETIDEIAGLPSGYCGKLLAPEPIKNLGWLSFGLVLNAFGKMLLLVDDEEQIRRIKHRWTPRERPTRPSAATAKSPPPAHPTSSPILTVVSGKRRAANMGDGAAAGTCLPGGVTAPS
jgi:hypothetical protein